MTKQNKKEKESEKLQQEKHTHLMDILDITSAIQCLPSG